METPCKNGHTRFLYVKRLGSFSPYTFIRPFHEDSDPRCSNMLQHIPLTTQPSRLMSGKLRGSKLKRNHSIRTETYTKCEQGPKTYWNEC